MNTCVYYVLYFYTKNDLSVYFLNIGQGDSIFIQTPNGTQVLVDGGPDSSVIRELSSVMPFYDRSIDMVIMTHPDSDHVGGLGSVLDRYSVDTILEPGVQSSTTAYTSFEKKIKTGTKKIFARRGMSFVLDKDIHLDILFPDRDNFGWETNTASIVSRLVFASSSVLLTGDSPTKIEKLLVKYDSNNIKSTILKLGHHGSHNSSDESFIKTVMPEYAVVSAGKNNRYHHPHADTIARVSKYVKNILNTAEVGRIHFVLKKDGVLYER